MRHGGPPGASAWQWLLPFEAADFERIDEIVERGWR
jgi:hypothetical protein